MMDHYKEEVIIKRNPGGQNALYALVTVMMFIFALIAFIYLQNIITVISTGDMGSILFTVIVFVITGGPAVLAFLRRDRIKTEYEYTFTNGSLDFAQVFNNKRRKPLGSMDVRKAEAFGKVSSGSFNRYNGMQGIKRTNWFLNRDSELYYFYVVKESNKRIIVFEPSEEMVTMIQQYLPRGVLQVN